MTAPADRTGDLELVAELTVDVDLWRDPAGHAEAVLALEEDLAGQARSRGRQLRDERAQALTWLLRHEWRDPETGHRRTWDELVLPRAADRVTVRLAAAAYRP